MTLTDRHPRRVTSILLTLVALFTLLPALAITVDVFTAKSAWACPPPPPGTICGSVGGGGNTGGGGTPTTPDPPTGGGGGSGGGGSGGGGGGGGGGVVETRNYFANNYFFYGDRTSPPVVGCVGRCGASYQSGPSSHYGGRCLGNHPQWGPWDGVQAFEDGEYGTRSDPEETEIGTFVDYFNAWHDCIPPAAWKDDPITCVHHFEMELVGPRYNPDVVSGEPGWQRRFPNTAFVQGGSRNPDLCNRSYGESVRLPLTEYGRYELRAVPYYTYCTLRIYERIDDRTSTIPDDEIINCSGPVSGDTVRWRAQLFCERPGWTPDWSGNHSFTTEDCLRSNNGIWNCGPEVHQNPWLAAKPDRLNDPTPNYRLANPVSVLDDGQNRRLRWLTPRPEGDLRNIENRRTRLLWMRGSPFRTNVNNPADGSQPFVTNPSIGSGIGGGWVNNWRGASETQGTSEWLANWQAAGLPNHPWTARTQWRFSAEFLFTEVTIETINVSTNPPTVETSTSRVWKRMTATCNGRPAEVNVSRARNSTH